MAKTILVVDDSALVRAQIINTLQAVSLFDTYLEAEDGIDAFQTILKCPVVDLILCDLEMPRMDGFKFIAMLQTRDELKDIPVIMLTGRENREMKIKSLDQGACDYVTKPFDAGELVARVKVQMKIKGLQDELKHSNELLKELSNTDPLTHLYNRRYLMQAMDREFERALRKQHALSLVMIDIDHFKKVNDTYGHQEGDNVLIAVSALLQGMVRRYDVAARYGGEEFVALLPDTSLPQAMIFAERCRCVVQEVAFGGTIEQLSITVSVGVATFPSGKVNCVDSLLTQADDALYRAKQGGRNRVEANSWPITG